VAVNSSNVYFNQTCFNASMADQYSLTGVVLNHSQRHAPAQDFEEVDPPHTLIYLVINFKKRDQICLLNGIWLVRINISEKPRYP
jgi:hypothetical protein